MKELEGTLTRILPLFLILMTSTIAILILAIRDRRSTGSLYSFATSNRDTIGLVIQIISAALGACQVFTITSLINLSARLRMQTGHPVEFRQLKFFAAITSGSSQAIRSALPVEWLTVVVIVVLALKIPAALWAGALTPVVADLVRNEGRIPVPKYPETAFSVWQGSFRRLENGSVDMSLNCTWNVTGDRIIDGAAAIVSTCPALDLVSALLGSLATAAAGTVNVPRLHSRIDNSGWTNLGRSFGVGSSPGIVAIEDLQAHEAPMLSFDYFEYGYRTDVSCAPNETANYTISQGVVDELGASSSVVSGTLPNSMPGHIEDYILTASDDQDNLLAWSALSNNGQNILAVAATGWYALLDKLQCSIRFEPERFAVNVNVTNSIITAKPAAGDHPIVDVEPTGQLTISVFYALEQISRMSGNTVVSSLGTPLEHNSRIIKERNSSLSDEVSAVLSLEYGVGILLENLLVAYGQSQMFILGDSTTVPLSVRYRAIKVGSDKYIYAVLASNLLVFLATVYEILRTKLWSGLTVFDFTDIQNMATAASAGGTSIAERCLDEYKDGCEDPKSSRLSVFLRTKGKQWALRPAAEAVSVEGPGVGDGARWVQMKPGQWATVAGANFTGDEDICNCDDEEGRLIQ